MNKKQNKTICIDVEVFDYLQTVKPNASVFIQDLIYADMAAFKKKKEERINLSDIHSNILSSDDEKQKKEVEQQARSKAWELLDFEVREEIKDMESWGVKWREQLYPLYLNNGNKLDLHDVREWYFAQKKVILNEPAKESPQVQG